MDSREEDVIIACGLYLLAEEEKRVKRKYWIHSVFRAREEEGEFHTLFRRLKDDRQKFFKYFRMSISKFENLKQLLHTDIEKNNTRWRRSTTVDERLALTLRLVHKNV
jgi:arginyl-tRNA--protein-N-Asp/Glu arginylyltransferase